MQLAIACVLLLLSIVTVASFRFANRARAVVNRAGTFVGAKPDLFSGMYEDYFEFTSLRCNFLHVWVI